MSRVSRSIAVAVAALVLAAILPVVFALVASGHTAANVSTITSTSVTVVNASKSTITASGQYTDDAQHECELNGRVVTIDAHTDSATGNPTITWTTTTGATGSWGPATSANLNRGHTYFVTATVQGTLAAGYAAPHICNDATSSPPTQVVVP